MLKIHRYCTALIVLVLASPVVASPVGTAFTYQGKLFEAGQPATGAFDFDLSIFDDPGAANALESRTYCAVTLEDGVFSLEVDFGEVFDGDRRWVEVGVVSAGDCDGSTIFTYLDPRHEVTAAPYAVTTREALNADRLDGLEAADFLRSTGSSVAEDLILTGSLVLDPGATLVFPDGSVQTTAAAGMSEQIVTQPEVYEPARLVCGGAAQGNFLQWGSLASGTFQIHLDGTDFDVAASFVGVSTMDDVAARIEAAIRSQTNTDESVIWISSHFEFASSETGAGSSIAPLESSGLPIDISGLGAEDWLDCDEGNASVIETILDRSAYAGALVALDSESRIDPFFIPKSETGVSVGGQLFISGSGASGPEVYVLDVPVGVKDASSFEIFYFSYVYHSGGSGFFAGSRGVLQGAVGGDVLNRYKFIDSTTSFSSIQGIEFIFDNAAQFSKQLPKVPVNGVFEHSNVDFRMLSVEAKGDKLRLTFEIETVVSGSWYTSFAVRGALASR